MWRLLTFLLIVNDLSAIQSQEIESKEFVTSVSEIQGFFPTCVASSILTCELFAQPDFYLLPELQTLLRQIKCVNSDTLTPSFTNNLADKSASMTDVSTFLQKINSLPFEKYLKNVIDRVTKHQESNLETVNNPSTHEDNCKNEETKFFSEKIKELKLEVKNIGSEILRHVVKKPKICSEASLPNAVTTLYPYEGNVSRAVRVACDGGWTVIQNRDFEVARQDFNRSWSDYVSGFGDVKGEFWLGLENIHALTHLTPMELRVDLEDSDGEKKWAQYDLFKIGDASAKYSLALGEYSGNAGDSLSTHNGRKFSTYDHDNDESSTSNCALKGCGGWWFRACRFANLNGYPHIGDYYSDIPCSGIEWYHFHKSFSYSFRKASMKVHPKSN